MEGATGAKFMTERSTLEALNKSLFVWIHSPAGTSSILDGFAMGWAITGPYLLVIMFVGLWFRADHIGKKALVQATLTSLVGLGLNQLVGLYYFHSRPFMVGLGEPLFSHSPETSFPSDHATLMFSASFSLLLISRKISWGLWLLAFSLFTAWGRVFSGVHFPFDMAGSLAVAFTAATLLWSLPERYEKLVIAIAHNIDRMIAASFDLVYSFVKKCFR